MHYISLFHNFLTWLSNFKIAASMKLAYYHSLILMIISLKLARKCQNICCVYTLNGLQNQNFTFKKNIKFECQMASVGTWSHNGDFSSECENCRFSTETFWRLVFSHEWFIIHLQRDEVELEMNSEPRVWEHQSSKCWVGELCSLPPHYCEI